MTVGRSAGVKVCDDCGQEYAGPAYYTFDANACTDWDKEAHEAIRPATYPTIDEIGAGPFPASPPFCVTCGEEMLTVGDTTQGGVEWHAEERLNPRPHLGCTGNLCPSCAGTEITPDRADDPRRPSPPRMDSEARS